MATEVSESDSPPSYLGAYRITKVVGTGGFGLVYEAYQPFLERRAAIKVLRTDLSTVRATEAQFMHEARTIARLRHPNIVTVYEFGIAELHNKPVTYMVMEYLPGKTLRTVMRQQALNAVQIVEIVEQLARALDYAHSNSVIHRDLKPANIMFSDQNQPVIVDFGLAKLAEISTSYDHLAGDPISMAGGTPAYMSPEQCVGAPVGPASDQYSLALIVYEMLAGQAPFANVNASDWVAARLNSVPAPLSAIAPQYPPRADRVLQRALRTDPGLRYPTAADFARDLSEALVPDRVVGTTITISDPLQAAELRKAQQTVLGFLWGVILVTFVVALFCSVLYLRGYLNGDSPFIWDGIVASNSIRDGYRDVLALWPGSPAQMAGVQPGDQIKTDIFYDNTEQNGDFSVNEQPRSRYPVHWHPQEGDVVERTVLRNGQPVRVSYPLVRSAFNLIVLAVQLPPAVLAFGCAWWLLRRWRTEPGGQIGTMLLMAASFALVASGVTDVITNIDSLAMYILLPLLLHLTLVFPQPIRHLRDHPKMIWWLYLPLPLGLVEFLLGVPGFDRLNLVVYAAYSLLNLGAVIMKWGRHDLKRFRPMWLLLAAWFVASVTSLLGEALATFDDYTIVRTLWGGNGLLLLAVDYGVITLGSFLAIVLGTLGLHRVQMLLGHAVKTEVPQPEVFETIIMNL